MALAPLLPVPSLCLSLRAPAGQTLPNRPVYTPIRSRLVVDADANCMALSHRYGSGLAKWVGVFVCCAALLLHVHILQRVYTAFPGILLHLNLRSGIC